MPQILVTLLIWFSASLIARVLAGAGLAIFTYNQIESYMNDFIRYIQTYLGNLPHAFLQLAALAGIDFYLSVVLSSLSVATAIYVSRIFIGRNS